VVDITRPTEPVVPNTVDEIKTLLVRAEAGDESALPIVRRMLENPICLQVFGGEPAERVEAAFIGSIGGKDVAFREAVLKKLDWMRAELLGENPTAVERLLVERIAACWLQVQHAELRYAQNLKDMTFPQGDYHQRRMDATNRRFLAAVKALALVRKLAVPALQLNIAKRQVNVVARRL
jgi:hypothetical protein